MVSVWRTIGLGPERNADHLEWRFYAFTAEVESSPNRGQRRQPDDLLQRHQFVGHLELPDHAGHDAHARGSRESVIHAAFCTARHGIGDPASPDLPAWRKPAGKNSARQPRGVLPWCVSATS